MVYVVSQSEAGPKLHVRPSQADDPAPHVTGQRGGKERERMEEQVQVAAGAEALAGRQLGVVVTH
jgi:hypothetical protein